MPVPSPHSAWDSLPPRTVTVASGHTALFARFRTQPNIIRFPLLLCSPAAPPFAARTDWDRQGRRSPASHSSARGADGAHRAARPSRTRSRIAGRGRGPSARPASPAAHAPACAIPPPTTLDQVLPLSLRPVVRCTRARASTGTSSSPATTTSATRPRSAPGCATPSTTATADRSPCSASAPPPARSPLRPLHRMDSAAAREEPPARSR